MNQRVIKKVRCNICSAGCPIDAYVEEGTLVSVEGSRDLPGQSGGLCSKGAASRQYVYNKDRILYPMKRIGKKGNGEFERISWDEACLSLGYLDGETFDALFAPFLKPENESPEGEK